MKVSVNCIRFCLYSGGVGRRSTAGDHCIRFFPIQLKPPGKKNKNQITSENSSGRALGGAAGPTWKSETCGHQMPAAFVGRAQTPVISEPPMLPLGSTIPTKGAFIFFYACGANVLTLETGTCHFMPAASLRALAAVNEQQTSDHLNGISRVNNVSYQRKILHVSR